ncbi:MAG TPA: hypothetical protein VG757_07185 [Devosia sp.]|nr:hypothetical protein [Devosia sp.]
MNMASDTKYAVSASFSAMGDVPMSAAIAGSDVAITVESMFSMNKATARMMGTIRCKAGLTGEAQSRMPAYNRWRKPAANWKALQFVDLRQIGPPP